VTVELEGALRDVEARIAEHPGYIAFQEHAALQDMINHVVEPNWRQLLAVLDAPAANPVLALELIQNMRPAAVREKYTAELSRALHNYLASAFTLIDHVRRIMRNRNDEVATKHHERLDALPDVLELPFVKNLRNYTLHQTLPVVRHELEITHPNHQAMTMDSRIQLDVVSLLKWKGWSAASKRFLAQCGDHVDLRPVIQKHGEAVLTLNAHLLNDLLEANKADLADLNRLVLERNAVLLGGDIERAERVTDAWTRRRTGEQVGGPLF
jgi:hypothetical protein